MPLVISTTIAVNDTTSSYTIAVTGKNYSSNGLSIRLYVGGVEVASASGAAVSSLTLTGVTETEVWTNINGKSRTNGCSAIAVEYDPSTLQVIQTSVEKFGNVTINKRIVVAAPTSPTTANPLDIGLANPVNISAAVTYPSGNPSNFFRTWIEVYVWNGTSYVMCADRAQTGNVDWDIPSYSATDKTNIINAMDKVSPRDLKIIFYTVCNFEQLWVVGGAIRTTTITDGVIDSTLGGKIKVYTSSFVAKPIKWFNGSAWVAKPLKQWTGTEWKKSKN